LFPRANKSVVASLLERQPTVIPRLNYSLPEPLRTCGVVWGTGEVSFTGEAGSGPLSLEAQWQKGVVQIDPKGPANTDLMRLLTGAQGSMGIVVWASIRCELLPGVHKYAFVPGRKLDELIDLCYQLSRTRLGDELLIVNAAQLALILGKESGDVTRGEGLPSWVLVIGLAGTALFPQEKLNAQDEDLHTMARACGLAVLNSLPGVANEDVIRTVGGVCGVPYWKLVSKGGSHPLFFLSTLERTPRLAETVERIAEHFRYPTSNIGIYIQPQHQGVSNHMEFTFPFNPSDSHEVDRVKQIYYKASKELMAQGAYFSRPYGIWADLVYSRDATATRLLRTVKGIVDPKNVLNPGKLCF